ncbi:PDZ domain-containing protein [Caldicellulosiruptoraceae bacterium PP1]
MNTFYWQMTKLAALNIVQSLFSFYFWVVIIIVVFLYKREQTFENHVLGYNRRTLSYKVVESTLAGIVGGFIASLVILYTGIVIDIDSFMYLWYIALILALINPRYLCFSYAGGIISVVYLITGYPKTDVSGLMIIVAILHLIESILIAIDGYKGSIPVIINHKNGVSGAYLIERFWPIPMMMIALATVLNGSITSVDISQPNWWPLFKQANIDRNAMLLLTPVVAALGYGDIAVNNTPEIVSKKTSIELALFSITLFALSALSYKYYIFKWIAALFAPIAHETIIIIQQKLQRNGKSIFLPSHQGVKVLYVVENEIGEKLGIKPGDTILSINGATIYNENVLKDFFNEKRSYIWLTIIDKNGNKKELNYQDYKGIEKLGILIVTNDSNVNYILESEGYFVFLKNIMLSLKSLFSKR